MALLHYSLVEVKYPNLESKTLINLIEYILEVMEYSLSTRKRETNNIKFKSSQEKTDIFFFVYHLGCIGIKHYKPQQFIVLVL